MSRDRSGGGSRGGGASSTSFVDGVRRARHPPRSAARQPLQSPPSGLVLVAAVQPRLSQGQEPVHRRRDGLRRPAAPVRARPVGHRRRARGRPADPAEHGPRRAAEAFDGERAVILSSATADRHPDISPPHPRMFPTDISCPGYD